MRIRFVCLAAALLIALLLPPTGVAAQFDDPPIVATVATGAPRLRVRAGPGEDFPLITHLYNGQRLPALARDDDGRWLLVDVPGGPYGWVATEYVWLNVPIDTVPIAGAPAEPVPAAASVPVIPPPGPGVYGKLAVPVFDATRRTYDVWLVNADGSGLRRAVTEASAPALSYDGTLLVYRSWKVDERGIVIAGSEGADPLRVTDKLEDVLPAFAPDRTKVVFSTYRWGDRKSRIYYAWTDEQNRVAWEWGDGGIFGEDPEWMADGRILFRRTRYDIEQEELWSMDGRDGTQRTLLYTAPSIRAPAAAPDSRHVVFMAFDQGNWDLYGLDLATDKVRRLTNSPAQEGLPVWSPNGETIAFVSDRDGAWALYIMDADGGHVRRVVTLPGSVDGYVEFEPDYLTNGWLEEQMRVESVDNGVHVELSRQTEQGRGILGVVDGLATQGIETEEDISERKALLRRFGYKM